MIRNKETKQYGMIWITGEDTSYDYIHDIAALWYNQSNNPFNCTMFFGELHNYYGYFIRINNTNPNDENFNVQDCFDVDILYNTIIDIEKCKWSNNKIDLLHNWIHHNFITLMELWHNEDDCMSIIDKLNYPNM